MMMEYIVKYNRVSRGDNNRLAKIHAEWEMDEYAIRVRIWV